jgi:hypothetical protein
VRCLIPQLSFLCRPGDDVQHACAAVVMDQTLFIRFPFRAMGSRPAKTFRLCAYLRRFPIRSSNVDQNI